MTFRIDGNCYNRKLEYLQEDLKSLKRGKIYSFLWICFLFPLASFYILAIIFWTAKIDFDLMPILIFLVGSFYAYTKINIDIKKIRGEIPKLKLWIKLNYPKHEVFPEAQI